MKDNTIAYSYPFNTKILSDIFENQYSSKLLKVFKEFDMLDSMHKDMTVKEFFENAYKKLLNNYRNEYVFKNAIAQKILIGRHSVKTSLLLTEFRVESSKADIVIFNGTSHAYEIKTELDNIERLEKQIKDYKKAFEYVNIVSVESKINEIVNLIDDTVGIIILTKQYTFKTIRKAKSGLKFLDKEALFNILRKNEYLKIIQKYYKATPDVPNTKINFACKSLFKQLSIEDIHREVLKTLKDRNSHKNLTNKIKEFPNSLKIAVLEANLSIEKQNTFLELLNQNINAIFKSKDSYVSPIF